jgi:uncharacterized protein (DUF2147 family)
MPQLNVKRFAFAAVGLGLSAALAFAAPRPAPAPSTAEGMWEQMEDNGKVGSWFYIYEREGVFEGKIVKMFLKPGENPNPPCIRCTGEQKNQPTLGLTLIKGMQKKGRSYENGTILDPRDGSVYSARMELSPDGQKLIVRGYLGIELFGQSQTWRRLPDSTLAEVTGTLRPEAGSPKAAPQAQNGKPVIKQR